MDLWREFRSIIITDLKMAACCSNGEFSGKFSLESDSDFSDFGDSDSDEEQAIDDNIYGYPNDLEGEILLKMTRTSSQQAVILTAMTIKMLI